MSASLPSCVAIIAAAGSGTRMACEVPKALITVRGKSLVQRSLEALKNALPLESIVVLARREDRAAIEALLKGQAGVRVAEGGATRKQSVSRGLAVLADDREVHPETLVLIHDAARCLVSPALIRRVVEVAAARGAAVPALPVSDTLKQCAADGVIRATVPRHNLFSVQTPQVFRFDLLTQAHAQGDDEATDDAALVEALAPVAIAIGEKTNIKITTPDDLIIAEALLTARGE